MAEEADHPKVGDVAAAELADLAPPPEDTVETSETKSKTVKAENDDDAATKAHGQKEDKEGEEKEPKLHGTAIYGRRRQRRQHRMDKKKQKEVIKASPHGPEAVAQRALIMGSNRTGEIASSSLPPAEWPKPYYLEAGLRRVEPYFYTYNTWVKERWRGRSLISVFECEFRDRPLAYYRNAMESGTVTVNDKVVGPEHVLTNGERVSHTLHRHEPPVTADSVHVIYEDDNMLVINKPAGVPVHPAGRYQYNSVVEILKHERGPDFTPYPCNRLDRLTSGIMFLAKDPQTARRLGLQIQARVVRKEYLARCVGRFPDGEVVCDQPILQISPKLGLNRVRANGRSARTVFKRLAYYDDPKGTKDAEGRELDETRRGHSIVRCLPVTGRTHQIRVHLQYLGHPIENDPIYANQKVWGFDLGEGDAEATRNTDEDIISRLSRMGKEDVAEAVAYYDEMVDEYHKRKAERISGEVCDKCDTPLYTDPGEHELSLWLHSLRYEASPEAKDVIANNGEGWSFLSPLPVWALPPDGTSGPTAVGGLDDLLDAEMKAPEFDADAGAAEAAQAEKEAEAEAEAAAAAKAKAAA